MPITLKDAAVLGHDRPPRRWVLVVMGHGRWQYMFRTIDALKDALGGLQRFDRLILSLDGRPAPAIGGRWEIHTTGLQRKGLTANLEQAWSCLDGDEWVFHVEEDFAVYDAPLEAMADVLDDRRDVANMVLLRQPWGAHELQAGSVLETIDGLVDEGGWCRHKTGFWLNPMVAHASLLRSLQPGVEQALTEQCLARGLSFGYWGSKGDPPRCEHIGIDGGMGSPGWLT